MSGFRSAAGVTGDNAYSGGFVETFTCGGRELSGRAVAPDKRRIAPSNTTRVAGLKCNTDMRHDGLTIVTKIWRSAAGSGAARLARRRGV